MCHLCPIRCALSAAELCIAGDGGINAIIRDGGINAIITFKVLHIDDTDPHLTVGSTQGKEDYNCALEDVLVKACPALHCFDLWC